MKVVAHERLGDVLCTLKSVLQRYPPLNTTELFSAAATLIGKIKSKFSVLSVFIQSYDLNEYHQKQICEIPLSNKHIA